MRQLLDLVMTCKRNAENELRREKGERTRAPEKKRKMEQETAERALKYFKASQEPAKPDKTAGEDEKTHNAPCLTRKHDGQNLWTSDGTH